MKTFEKIWRARGIMVFVYLDDILVIGPSRQKVQTDITFVLQTLNDSGMGVNLKKSQPQPSQEIRHLGFTIDFKQGTLEVPKDKRKTLKRELGKLITHDVLTCRKMAAILGTLRSCLTAIPSLRAFTDRLVSFVNQQYIFGWDCPLPLSQSLKAQVRVVGQLLDKFAGRQLLPGGGPKNATLGLLRPGLGWRGSAEQFGCQRVLASSNTPTHQSERTFGSSKHREKFSQTERQRVVNRGQSGHLLVPAETGGQVRNFQRHSPPILALVLGKQSSSGTSVGSLGTNGGGQVHPSGFGQGYYTIRHDLFQNILTFFSTWVHQTSTCSPPRETGSSPNLFPSTPIFRHGEWTFCTATCKTFNFVTPTPLGR